MNVQFKKPDERTNIPAKKVADWNKDEVFTGYYIETKSYEGVYGTCKYHSFVKADSDSSGNVTSDNEKVVFRGSAGLDNQIKLAQQNQLIRLTCEGTKKNPKTNRVFTKFGIEVAEVYYEKSNNVSSVSSVSDEFDDLSDIDWGE